MTKDRKTIEVRFRMTRADLDRLNFLAERLELTRAEVLRYYIRDAYAALATRIDAVPQAQLRLFPGGGIDGLSTVPVPLPAKPPEEPTL